MRRETRQIYEFGPFRIDVGERLLLRDSEALPLTPKTFDLLLALVENQGRALEKDVLMKMVWPDTFVEEGNLSKGVFLLRKTLGEGYIETLPKRGYRFIGEVRTAGDEETVIEEHSVSRVTIEEAPQTSRTTGRAPWNRVWTGLVAVLLLTLALATAWIARRGRPLTASVDSLVVLPFVNLSPDKDNEYFSDGLTEELINALSRVGGLRVVARTTAFQFKGKAQDIRSIGHQLGVAAVLEGSVRKEQNRLRVTVQLNSATNGYHFWSESYDRELKDVFAIQAEIAEAIRQTLGQKLRTPDAQPTSRRRTPNVAAYDLYLLGRYHTWRWNPQNLRLAIDYFERAIKLEPDFAAAYAGLALAWGERGIWGGMGFREVEGPSRHAALRAVELDPNLAEARAELGRNLFAYDWDWAGGERELQRAIELNRNSPNAYNRYGFLLMAMGRFPEAINQMEQAVSLDPLSSQIRSDYGRALFRARRFDEALRQFRRAIDLDSKNLGAYTRLGEVYELTGRFQEAVTVIEQALRLQSADLLRSLALARAYALAGRRKGALEILDRLTSSGMNSNQDLVALVYFALGDKDRGFERLSKAFDQRQHVIFTKFDPRFDSVRSDPRFRSLMARMRLIDFLSFAGRASKCLMPSETIRRPQTLTESPQRFLCYSPIEN